MITVSPSRQAALALAYAELPEMDNGAVPAFRAFREETMRQLDCLGVDVIVTDSEPYASAASMMRDVRDSGRIRVLGTRVTGSHPFLTDDQNDAFRAVHDVLGHAAIRRGFDRHGEEAAYLQHRRWYSPLARLALTTETRGQNAALIASATFAPQKIAILPAEWQAVGALRPTTAGEFRSALAQARLFHAAGGLS